MVIVAITAPCFALVLHPGVRAERNLTPNSRRLRVRPSKYCFFVQAPPGAMFGVRFALGAARQVQPNTSNRNFTRKWFLYPWGPPPPLAHFFPKPGLILRLF